MEKTTNFDSKNRDIPRVVRCVVNKIRLLSIKFTDSIIIEKILVIVPEEASITTLENTKDLSKIILVELLNALQSKKQRRLMRQDYFIKGALLAKQHDSRKDKKKYYKKNQASNSKITANNHIQNKSRNSK
jgi:hypothetical protein